MSGLIRNPRLLEMAARIPAVLVDVAALAAFAGTAHTLIEDFDLTTTSALTLAFAQALPLVFCLRWPIPAWLVSTAVAVVAAVVTRTSDGGPLWPDPSLYVHVAVMFLAGLRSGPRLLAGMWLGTIAAGVVLELTLPGPTTSPGLAEATGLSAVVLVAAGALHAREKALDRLAEQKRISEADRVRAALLSERARIARELHDVVAHHMSVVAIQAEAAPYRSPNAPAAIIDSLATIRTHALDSLAELRLVLGVLRGDDGSRADSMPQPTLRDLDRLVENVRGAGMTVTTSITGTPRMLSAGVQLSAYRIVQEALNNVMRHAPQSTVRISVDYGPDALGLRVENERPPGSVPIVSEEGHGILGMRERAAMLGGRLDAGPSTDGGYEVTASLPAAQEDEL